MGGRVDMSNNPPMSHTKDLLASPSPALTLSLAGIFRDGQETATAGASAAAEVNERDEESGCGGVGGRREEISSETSGPVRSRPEDDLNAEAEAEDSGGDDKSSKKKRKKYHRHTAEQIREMEALFKESPHPDEKQRQHLSKQLGLHPRQVKFWFQNRRTQIKAIQERHENSLLKSELDKLREENKVLRGTIIKARCLNCGFATSPKDGAIAVEEQQLRIENARLKAEVEKLQAAIGKFQPRTSPTRSSCSLVNDQESRNSLDFSTAVFGLEKSRIMDIVNQAMDELLKMGTLGEPLWIQSFETGREILNYDEYVRVFSVENSSNIQSKISIEATRESGIAFADLQRLVQSFMDVNQWKEMFPCIISKATTVYVICDGGGANKDGATQLMFAELQMLTPLVSPREVYFVRYSKQLNPGQWVIVDVSIDNVEDSVDASLSKCRKRPSGCIIKDDSNGHCKVIWVEHLEWQKSTVNSMYRSIVNSSLAFGARRWMASLQLQCEWTVFFMATNLPMKDSSGGSTLAGRKSILKLAQRMTWNFSRVLGASNYNTWKKVPSKTGDYIRVASRKNINDPGEPLGVILCAVSSVQLPVSRHLVFDFLRDETRKNEWDIMSNGVPVQSIANLAKGQDRGNAITIQSTAKGNSTWMIQDCSTNAFESMVVYSPVDVAGMQSVMMGCDSSNVAILPSGFSILPDGLESRPLLITSKPEEKSTEGGSLLTVAFQILTSTSPTTKPTMESVESVNTLLSCTLQKIKTSLQCEDD